MVSIEKIKELNKITCCGLQACKKALEEANDDIDKAINILKVKGVSVAKKRENNETNEGIVIAKTSENKKFGIAISLLSETDFVSTNSKFVDTVNLLADAALKNEIKTLEELKNLNIEGETVEEIRLKLINEYRENIGIKYTSIIGDCIYFYNHFTKKLSTLVSFKNATNTDKASEVGKNVAMHIAGSNYNAISIDSINKEIIDELIKKTENESSSVKDENIRKKIIEGKLNKYYQENVLLEQKTIWDDKLTIKQYLANSGNLIIDKVLSIEIGKTN